MMEGAVRFLPRSDVDLLDNVALWHSSLSSIVFANKPMFFRCVCKSNVLFCLLWARSVQMPAWISVGMLAGRTCGNCKIRNANFHHSDISNLLIVGFKCSSKPGKCDRWNKGYKTSTQGGFLLSITKVSQLSFRSKHFLFDKGSKSYKKLISCLDTVAEVSQYDNTMVPRRTNIS